MAFWGSGLHRPRDCTCLCSRRLQHSSCCRTGFQVLCSSRGREVKPAYNKYRSAKDIEQDNIKLWKEVTARDPGTLQPLTLWSSLAFVPAWVKFEATPLPLKFLWNCFWVPFVAQVQIVRKNLTLQGAKLDSFLTMGASQGARHGFSRLRVIRRWHNTADRVEDCKFRFGLLTAYMLAKQASSKRVDASASA